MLTPCYFNIFCSSGITKTGVQKVRDKVVSAECLCFTIALKTEIKKTENVFSAFNFQYVEIW